MAHTKRIPGGFFITLEGPEAAGKSTQLTRLAAALETRGYSVHRTREPGGTPLGEEVRKLVKHFGGPHSICAASELLLFGASRAQLMHETIQPALQQGAVVLCDRFADSTTVYQGIARRLDLAFIRQMHRLTTAGRMPDLTLLLDVDRRTSLARQHLRNGDRQAKDRFEAEQDAFHHLVREGFRQLARQEPQRIKRINADRPATDVHRNIMDIVNRGLEDVS